MRLRYYHPPPSIAASIVTVSFISTITIPITVIFIAILTNPIIATAATTATVTFNSPLHHHYLRYQHLICHRLPVRYYQDFQLLDVLNH